MRRRKSGSQAEKSVPSSATFGYLASLTGIRLLFWRYIRPQRNPEEIIHGSSRPLEGATGR